VSKARELADRLMDSRRFCLKADNFAGTWAKKRATDADKVDQLEPMLEAILEALGDESGPSTASEALSLKPVHILSPIEAELERRKRNKAPEAVDADSPLTATEAQAIRDAAKPITEDDLQGSVDRAVAEAIKPIWASAPMDANRAAKRFTVKAVRDGITISTQLDRWIKALAKAGLPQTVSFAYAGLAVEAGGSGDKDHHIVFVG
jgi:hypothetical protein